MRLLVVLLICLLVTCLCEAKHKGNHHGKHYKSQHGKKARLLGNHQNSVTGKLDVHRADGCNCPPDHMCVNGKATGGPLCVTADFIKEGKHLLKEFNERKSKGFQLTDDEPKPHLFNKLTHNVEKAKPHNLHISVYSKDLKQESSNQVKSINHHGKLHHHHKKGKKYHHKKTQSTTCTPDNMSEMRQRLAGWFRLLHAQDRENHPHSGHHHGHRKHKAHMSVKKELRNHHHEGHCKCLRSVIWELHHLDQDNDHHLNHTELREIEHNNMEPCLRPYLNSCDHNDDKRLSKNEWCCCFSEVLPPCYNELRSLQEKLLRNEKDLVLPKCDHEGFYAKEQCKGEHHKSRTCWCVDLNGNKIPHTESKRHAHCGKFNALGLPKHY